MKSAFASLSLLCCVLLTDLPAQDFHQWREKMVKDQLEKRGIKSSEVLKAMRKVERHRFVPEAVMQHAYDDRPLPIGEGQTISQPYVVAFMTQVLELKSSDKVLEIGTGSGYQAAILAEICKEVYTIEIVEVLGANAKKLLESLHYKNIFTKIGDGYLGWPEASPFDAIIVTCSPTHVPQPLQDQLREGGRMIIPVGEKYTQELVLLTKKNGKLVRQNQMPVLFVPMKDKSGKRYEP
jgi:protein-L-isoaspartate(D-aspartate) O-methyltransferase